MNITLIINRHYIKLICIVTALIMISSAFAPSGIAAENESEGLGDASEITGIDNVEGGTESIKGIIENIVLQALTFVALLATIVIIIAGVYLVAGAGSDTSVEKAKKIVIYTIVGIILIILAGAIVQFFINAGTGVSSETGT
ncbi:MAG: hypothetical protein K9M03_03705 [Kiritimatiellales bacterium]|nr:hypothetical protein [Kiritimatiellales bacterium]